MRKEKPTVERIKALIASSEPIAVSRRGFGLSYEELNFASGWMASAANCISLLTPLTSQYRSRLITATTRFDTAWMNRSNESSTRSQVVGEVRGILQALLSDIEAGLIIKLESRIVGDALDNFLDQAEYLARKNQITSGVLAGVVFEDTIRRIGREHSFKHRDVEQIINGLVKAEVLTEGKGKACKQAAHVRTKATHADWDAFDIADVKTAIAITRDLIETHLT